MGTQDHDFLKRLRATFEVEAREHIRAMSSGLIALERTTVADQRLDIIETIFREAHSLKGAARAVNLAEIEAICQALESVFAALKQQEVVVSTELYDTLHQALDSLGPLLTSPQAGLVATAASRISGVLQRLEGLPKVAFAGARGSEIQDPALILEPMPPPPVSGALSPVLAETVRISTAKLDALLLQVEELLSAKLAARQRTDELREINATLAAWRRERGKIHPVVAAVQQSLAKAGPEQAELSDGWAQAANWMRQLLDFLAWHDDYLKTFDGELATLTKAAEQDHRALGRMVDDLLEDLKKVSMQPFSSLLEVFPKLARDLARARGKEVEVVIHRGDIEIDRQILEEMKEPLIHIVRNCIDHGIEAPQERERKRKPRRGTVTVAISQKNGSEVELLVSDDGAGIDATRVKSAAQKLGLIAHGEPDPLNAQEALSLIFQSGVSTSPTITDISGRGLGLAIVREKAEKLGGVVSVDTSPDVGTTFRIVLPLTLAAFRGVLVQVAGHLFVLPLTQVERVMRVNKAEITTVESRETLQLNGQVVSLVRLEDALGLPGKNATDASVDNIPVVVLAAAEKRIAFAVGAVLGEQEVLVKRLGPQLPRVRNIAGATVLGTGQVVPVLNVPDVLKSAVRASAAAASPGMTAVEREGAGQKSVLIVEDSVTTRMLLKNLLETAGYRVRTAVDGVDGLAQLRSGAVDIVVSGVDMPRMNGFDLTAQIRGDKKFADVPVVLVTTLASPADRERGMQVGANAYLMKSGFDQSDLLAVIQRLA
jgi:two-component system, chemotaxis family, sensor kinase CheA